MVARKKGNRYVGIIEKLFWNHYKKGLQEFEFERIEIENVAIELGIKLPKNIGDILYSFRFRTPLPESISKTATKGREWIIKLAGRAKYKFRLAKINRILPTENAYQIKIPDATPEIILSYTKTDEQALLAKVRYNRLIDIFLRVTAYSLQNHLRTTVPDVGQIEIDELYVGVRNTGQQFIIPVQAKGGNDRLAVVQAEQDFEFCKDIYPKLTPRLVAVQFITKDVVAMFELVFQGEDLKKADEKQYKLVKANEILDDDLKTMANSSD
jgi:hypothetical protein